MHLSIKPEKPVSCHFCIFFLISGFSIWPRPLFRTHLDSCCVLQIMQISSFFLNALISGSVSSHSYMYSNYGSNAITMLGDVLSGILPTEPHWSIFRNQLIFRSIVTITLSQIPGQVNCIMQMLIESNFHGVFCRFWQASAHYSSYPLGGLRRENNYEWRCQRV